MVAHSGGGAGRALKCLRHSRVASLAIQIHPKPARNMKGKNGFSYSAPASGVSAWLCPLRTLSHIDILLSIKKHDLICTFSHTSDHNIYDFLLLRIYQAVCIQSQLWNHRKTGECQRHKRVNLL